MATNDVLISSRSNSNAQIEIEVIEGELGNNIRKPRKKSLEADPNQLGQISLDSNNWSFYKVPYPLREVNETAYEPYVISIGPYHHGKKRLETMEVIKRNCFRRMIEENNVEPEKFVTVMKKLEEKKQFRKYYEEPLDGFDSDTFVEMMVLDGCFIVLLFQRNNYLYTCLDKLKKGILDEICYDLLLLENQLPYSLLSELYGVITSNDEINVFSRSAFYLLSQVIPGPDICVPENFPKPEEIKHLLALVHHFWLLSAGKRHDAEAEEEKETGAGAEAKAQSLWKFICFGTESEEKGIGRKGSNLVKDNCSTKFIRCATELNEAGINFVNKGKEFQDKDTKDNIGEEEQYKKGKASLFDIDFTDGELKIPTLRVDDYTERILRNFMAYEQFLERSKPTYVSDYVTLMDNLINSGKDVQLLCIRGIIDNRLDDDEVVAQMFKKLVKFTCTPIDSDDFYYAEIFYHSNRRWNLWQAELKKLWNKYEYILKKDYFNSPWSIIKLLAAFVLFLLTGVQTVYSVLSYYHPK